MTSIESALTTEGLSSDEHQLKLLLDKVLVSSTTQPLRDDLGRAVPQILEAIQSSASTSQKRLMHYISSSQVEIIGKTEAELDTLLRRIRESIEDGTDEVLKKLDFESTKMSKVLAEISAAQQLSFDAITERLECAAKENSEKLSMSLASTIDAVRIDISIAIQDGNRQIYTTAQELHSKLLTMNQQNLRWHEEIQANNQAQNRMFESLQVQVQADNRISRRFKIWLIVLAITQIGTMTLYKYIL
jgi:hypothetical protein